MSGLGVDGPLESSPYVPAWLLPFQQTFNCKVCMCMCVCVCACLTFTWSLTGRAVWFVGSTPRVLVRGMMPGTPAGPSWRRLATHLRSHCCPLVTVETKGSSTSWFGNNKYRGISITEPYIWILCNTQTHPCVFWYQSALMRLEVRMMTLKPSSYHSSIIFLHKDTTIICFIWPTTSVTSALSVTRRNM